MSLDVALTTARDGAVFEFNITHNLTTMAEAAGIYRAMWRPEELGYVKAGNLICILEAGLVLLLTEPEKYRALSPGNGWGTYQGFVKAVRKYIAACKDFPEALIGVCR